MKTRPQNIKMTVTLSTTSINQNNKTNKQTNLKKKKSH